MNILPSVHAVHRVCSLEFVYEMLYSPVHILSHILVSRSSKSCVIHTLQFVNSSAHLEHVASLKSLKVEFGQFSTHSRFPVCEFSNAKYPGLQETHVSLMSKLQGGSGVVVIIVVVVVVGAVVVVVVVDAMTN